VNPGDRTQLLPRFGDWASIVGAVLTALQFVGISTGVLPGVGTSLRGSHAAYALAIAASVVVWGFLFLVQAKIFAYVERAMAGDDRYFLVWLVLGVMGLALCCGSVLLLADSLLPTLSSPGLTLWIVGVCVFWAVATVWWILASVGE
jgi:hypothetical protein